MTNRYDWDGIRARYESGETAYSISKSLFGSPTKAGIQKRANREGWLKISMDAKKAARNLPSIQGPTFLRAPSKELGNQSQENAERILSAFERGASPKIAAGLVGLKLEQLKEWMGEDHQFSLEIMCRVAQCAAERLSGVQDADDAKFLKWLLERDPFSREEYGPQRVDKEPVTFVLNILRDEVVIEQPQNEPIDVTPEREIESSVEPTSLDSIEVSEPEAMPQCWQGDDWRE